MHHGLAWICMSLSWVVFSGAAMAQGRPPRTVRPGDSRPVVERIPAGTVVGRTAPRGWSHLVVKSLPRLASGELGSLPASAGRTAGLFRTVILADVAPPPQGDGAWALRRIGIGLAAPDAHGRDVIVSQAHHADVGVDLGMTDRVVLRLADAELRRGALAVSAPTFALYRAPAAMLIGGAHRELEVAYAFLIDPESGNLRTLAWARDPAEVARRAPARLVELTPSLVYSCAIDVKAKRLLGTVPVSWSFAMTALPPGRVRDLTPAMARTLAAALRSPIDPIRLESAIRHAAPAGALVTEASSDALSEARAAADEPGPGRSVRTSISGSVRPGTRRGAR